MDNKIYDVMVIGGGINGSGIAVDAAMRGLKVGLCEAEDFASSTSSASSKLVHGGLRYLEQYEFKLVKEALREREVLIKKAPHLIHPLKFILPHAKHLRPTWMIHMGLFLYDFLAGKMSLPKSRKVDLKDSIEGQSLNDAYKVGFSYSDCRIDDARMVIANVLDAQSYGADIFVPYACTHAQRNEDGLWEIQLQGKNNSTHTIKAKSIINAAGPWVADIINDVVQSHSKSRVRLVKGSHIVVPKLYEGDHAYILQNKDGRIVFALPYGFKDQHQNDFTVIGTTDIQYQGDPRKVQISGDETQYLCELISEYFKKPVKPSDVLSSWSGVRPLYDDNADNPSKVTREYHLEVEDKDGKVPLISIFGGKITTYRTLSMVVVDRLKPYFSGLKNSSTANAKSYGGDFNDFNAFFESFKQKHSWLPQDLAYRLASSYGSQVSLILKDATSLSALGQDFGCGLYETELNYLYQYEWCHSVEALLWRRTKLGLWMDASAIAELQQWFDAKNAMKM